ncbi:MAG: CDP-alcohol phosphatidyltransferase family protein [Ignavibacteriae bacterium]|nr:CDP-alcohol phosphatidyltransferase family protein [Ignavibacteriota bacterium]
MWQIESTYKARDVEEVIDRYFYRRVGYVLAGASKAIGLTPNGITIISILVGVSAGHLFYYDDLLTNIIGMLVLVTAEAMDSADGQLARMTNARSRLGRILDGIAGNLIFLSIYLHLCLRIIASGESAWIFLVAVASGISHSFQCATADYYRNAFLYFVYGEERSELDKASLIEMSYRLLTWKNDFIKKFFLRVYLNYTYQQEVLARNFQQLYATTRKQFDVSVPDWLRQEYASNNKPLLKYYNFITTNTRMIALFCALLIGNVYLYFAFELIVLNAVLIGLAIKQENLNRQMLESVRHLPVEA